MAEVVRERSNDSSGIKLFGATISISEAKDDDQESSKGEDQTADKRPDKIIPCPRCRSMETKFCYFNNYNVNQPRHFCRGCQRYWTAGGALRNVPVGAGRRKTKPPCRGLSEQLNYGGDEWGSADHGGFEGLCPAKRRRCGSDSQTC